MITGRVIVCLDVKDGKTTKGIKFKGNVDIGDPIEMAEKYYKDGVDELVFYDITASPEKRGIMIDLVEKIAKKISVPFTVGGGIGSIDDIKKVFDAGANKVSINSLAVKNPSLIEEGASMFGKQAILLGMDALADAAMPSGYRVVINGGRTQTELDALEWAQRAEKLGAGEIVLNSIDCDGVKQGYEIKLTRLIATNVGIPVIASGGAGTLEHLSDAFINGKASAVLVASMVHYGDFSIKEIKEYLSKCGISANPGKK
ncbi:MAG: imidazole glycerol phosphate synthase subunit HisF [Spirochaetes bacterium]|nr:imidazole glycerol phosphate synthase subunit HisF [Spirochaetota bacterium]